MCFAGSTECRLAPALFSAFCHWHASLHSKVALLPCSGTIRKPKTQWLKSGWMRRLTHMKR